jgi:lysophospholipase L1-like esterase
VDNETTTTITTKIRFQFNEHRRLYFALPDLDFQRLSGIYGCSEHVLREYQQEFLQIHDAACSGDALQSRFTLFADRVRAHAAKENSDKLSSLLVIGDSNSSNRLSYVNTLKRGIHRVGVEAADFHIIDTSVPGLTSQGVIDRLYDQVLNRSFATAVVMIGTNDVRRSNSELGKNNSSPEEYGKNLRVILSELAAGGKNIITITIPPIDGQRLLKNFTGCNWTARVADICAYNRIITAVTEEYNGFCIDLYALVGGATDTSVLSDGLHLHPSAHNLITASLLDYLTVL